MSKILISPFSKRLRDKDGSNPKDYPIDYWEVVTENLNKAGILITQIGVFGEPELSYVDYVVNDLPLAKVELMLKEYNTFICVDNFLHHMAHLICKKGVVIFGQSDPIIFGHPENINLLKDRKYLREKQFDIWEAVEYNKDCFVDPEEVIKAVNTLL